MTSIGGAEMVDWNLAVATATRLVRPGPEVSRDEARAVVAELRRHAKASEEHVRGFTRLGTEETHDTPVLVVDRPGWVRANVGGRLLLVAPNIVHVERELDVEPHDFRLWVCLHEETHRTQFTAVPWLRDHLEGEIQSFLGETEIDPMTLLERFREAAQSLAGGRPEGEEEDGGRSFVELVQTPAQREILARLTAVMSLLEGHADFVMDGVGPEVVATVAEIREKFQRRRASGAG